MTRTERWKEYRDSITKENRCLTVNQRDLIAMYFVEQSIIKLPENIGEAQDVVISRYKIAREMIEEHEIKEANEDAD